MADDATNDDIDNNNVTLDDNIDIPSLLADAQKEINALKKELDSTKIELTSAKREAEKFRSESERENKKGKAILDEKKGMLEKVKFYQDMHDGVEDDVARELLNRAREGGGADFESEKQRIMESAVNDFKENHYDALLDETQDLKELVSTLKDKLHKSVVVSTITKNALKYGVKPTLAQYVVSEFDSRMKIDEKGDMVYLNKEGYPTQSYDWKAAFLMLKQDKPDLFNQSKGSSTNPSLDVESLNDVNVNPWKKETRNPSMQARLIVSDRERANKLRAEAGLKPV